MANKIIFIFVACLISESFSFDFEQISGFKGLKNQEEFVSDFSARIFDEETCTNQLNLFSDALSRREFWALRRKTFV